MSNKSKIWLQKWAVCPDGNYVALAYGNDKEFDILFVRKGDFDRALMTIINAGYDAVKKEFAVNPVAA